VRPQIGRWYNEDENRPADARWSCSRTPSGSSSLARTRTSSDTR
jgi:hypothetical protein